MAQPRAGAPGWSSRSPAISSQLFLTYRNLALVLRDVGRSAEALDAAQQALAYAPESELDSLKSLIADLQGQSTP